MKFLYTYKGLIVFIGLALFASSCQELDCPACPEDTRPLKTVEKWLVQNGSYEKVRMVSFKKYDIEGNLVKMEEFHDNGELKSSSFYTNNGNTSTEELKNYSYDGVVEEQREINYTFDKDGNVVLRLEYKDDSTLCGRQVYEYDEKGNLIKRIEYNPTNGETLEIDYSYNYNSDGIISERIISPHNGSVSQRDSIVYNEYLVRRFSFDEAGVIKHIRTFLYNRSGRIIRETISSPEGEILKVFKLEYTYY